VTSSLIHDYRIIIIIINLRCQVLWNLMLIIYCLMQKAMTDYLLIRTSLDETVKSL